MASSGADCLLNNTQVQQEEHKNGQVIKGMWLQFLMMNKVICQVLEPLFPNEYAYLVQGV